MTLLESVSCPRDLKALSPDGAARFGGEIRDFLDRGGVPHRRPPRPQPRRGRADHRAAPGVRLADGPHRLRHRPPGLRAQDAHRPAGRLRPAAPARRRCPATRAGPSPSTTSSRTRTPPPRCPTPTAWPRPTRCAARTGTSVRRGRRRRAHRRHVPGRRSTTSPPRRTAAGHRRQRQRPLLHADRSAGSPTTCPRCGSQPELRAGARPGQGRARPHARWSARRCTRRCTRSKKGIKDALAPQGAVRGPRHQVRRARSTATTARRSSRRCAEAERLRRPGDRARGDPQGLRLPHRPRTTRPTACTGPAAFDPETGKPTGAAGAASGPTCSPTSWSRSATSAPDVVGDHRRDGSTRPASRRSSRQYPERAYRRRHRRAARGHLRGRPGARRPAPGGRRSTRRSSTGRSTRCCSTSRCTGCRSRSCSTGPASPARTAPSHNGIWDMSVLRRRAGPAARRARGTHPPALAELLREAVGHRDGRAERPALPRARPAPGIAASGRGRPDGTCLPGARARLLAKLRHASSDCCWQVGGPRRPGWDAVEAQWQAAGRGYGRWPSIDRAGVEAAFGQRPCCAESRRRGHRLSRDRRGQRPGRGFRGCTVCEAAPGQRGVSTPCADVSACRRSSWSMGSGKGSWPMPGWCRSTSPARSAEAVARLTPELEHHSPV